MKNILLLCCSGGKGGIGEFVKEIVKSLHQDFGICVVAENDFILDNLRKIENSDLKVYATKKGRGILTIIRNLFYLRKIIKEQKIELILTNTNKDALYSALLNCLFVKIPRLIMVHDFQWINRNFIWRFNPKSTILIPSKAILEKKDYIPNWKTFVVPNFVNMEQDISKNFLYVPIVLCLANISRWKGTIYLLRSFAIAKEKVPEIRLCIVGSFFDKEYEKECFALIEKLNLNNSIDFVSFTDNTREQYEKCSLVVNSSISEFGGPETFGRTIIEAWNYAKPVISFACGGPKYIIEDGVDGFLIPEKNVEAMAGKILLLGQNRELAKKMGEAGLEKIKNQYCAEIVGKQLKKIIEDELNA